MPEGPSSFRRDSLIAYARGIAPDMEVQRVQDQSRFELGTIYRDAAILALLWDADLARDDLMRSAAWYEPVVPPLAAWYRISASGQKDYQDAAIRLVHERMSRRTDTDDERWFPAADAYMPLIVGALASKHPALREHAQSMHQLPQASSVVPVGALGLPLRWYWQLGELLGTERRPDRVVGHMRPALWQHESSLDQAQVNSYLYERWLSPVDFVDLDLALTVCHVGLRWGPEVGDILGETVSVQAGLGLAISLLEAPSPDGRGQQPPGLDDLDE